MKLIPAKKENITSIMQIVKEAQTHLASQNIDQWQDGYPDELTILKDISNIESFLVQSENNELAGITMFTTQKEPTYSNINGAWLTQENKSYGVIHRMAVSATFREKGIAKFIFTEFEKQLRERQITSMRIDTHEDNMEMQGLLKKLDYVYCGIILLNNGDKRLAFEKIIN